MRTDYLIRPIEPRDDADMAAVIRHVMPEFGADGPGFAIHDPEVDGLSAAYARPRVSLVEVVVDPSSAAARLQQLALELEPHFAEVLAGS